MQEMQTDLATLKGMLWQENLYLKIKDLVHFIRNRLDFLFSFYHDPALNLFIANTEIH